MSAREAFAAAAPLRSAGPAWSEADRLLALRDYAILDTPPERAFDDIARLAMRVCRAPVALIAFVAEGRQWFKAEVGLGTRETPLDPSFCADALLEPGLLIVPDVLEDPRFAGNPLISGNPRLRFYAGALLETPEGLPLGMTCVLDREPRPEGLDPEQQETLLVLARQVMTQLEHRRALARLARREHELSASERRFRTVADTMPQIVWSTRPDGYHDYFNRRWSDFTGLAPEMSHGDGWSAVLHPDDCERSWRIWRQSLATGEPYETGYRFRRVDGSYRWFIGRALPIRNQRGEIERWLGTCTDIHELKEAEVTNARLAAIVSSSSEAILSFAPEDGRIQSWNKAAEAMFGYAEAEAVGAPLTLLLPEPSPGASEPKAGLFFEAMDKGKVRTETLRRRKDGTLLEVSITATRMTDAEGRILGVSGIFQDISERKRAAARQQLLIRELHHRVKNTLATVQGLLGATARSTSSVEDFYQSFSDRIVSLASTHTLLTEDYWQTASLRDMLRNELAPYDDGASRRIVLEGPMVELAADLAVPTGMAIHELTTNAAKYGALSSPGGRVEVVWDLRRSGDQRRLHLDWTERGGPPVAEPRRKGFGSILLQRVLTAQCNADVSFAFEKDGLHFAMDAPLIEQRLVPEY